MIDSVTISMVLLALLRSGCLHLEARSLEAQGGALKTRCKYIHVRSMAASLRPTVLRAPPWTPSDRAGFMSCNPVSPVEPLVRDIGFRDEAVERPGRDLQRSLTRGSTGDGGCTLDRCSPLDQGIKKGTPPGAPFPCRDRKYRASLPVRRRSVNRDCFQPSSSRCP